MNKSKYWISVAIPCTAFSLEAVGNFLFEMGALGIEEQDRNLIAYFPGDLSLQKIQHSLNTYLEGIKEWRWNKFVEYPDYSQLTLPVTEHISTNHFELPIHPGVTEEEIGFIQNSLTEILT